MERRQLVIEAERGKLVKEAQEGSRLEQNGRSFCVDR
jgi:hypothetical protein